MQHKVYSGKEFNELKKDTTFYKIIQSKSFRRRVPSFEYKLGLNVDSRPFTPTERLIDNRLDFTDSENAAHWSYLGNTVVVVTIPDDAQVAIGQRKYKADKIILSSLVNNFENEDIVKILFRQRPYYLKRISKQTNKERKIAYDAIIQERDRPCFNELANWVVFNPDIDRKNSLRLDMKSRKLMPSG